MARQAAKAVIRPTQVSSVEPSANGSPSAVAAAQPPCRIALVDGDADVHLAVRNTLEGEGWHVESYLTAAQAVAGISSDPPNAVLIDIQLPVADGLELFRKLKTLFPHLPIVIFTARDDPEAVLGSLAAGADGYLIKPTPPSAIVSAIRDALAGDTPLAKHSATILAHCLQAHAPHRASLTSREQEVIVLLLEKKTDKEIAVALGIEPGTVHTHLADIFRRLGAKNRAQAIAKYLGLKGEVGK